MLLDVSVPPKPVIRVSPAPAGVRTEPPNRQRETTAGKLVVDSCAENAAVHPECNSSASLNTSKSSLASVENPSVNGTTKVFQKGVFSTNTRIV